VSEARATTGCDLCGASPGDWELLAEESPDNCSVVMCRGCTLMQAAPRLAPSVLDDFYDDSFSFDHGSPSKAVGGLPDPARLASEEGLALEWALPILRRHLDLKERRVLDLRCRSAALSAVLVQEGSELVGVEPFEANVNHARQVRGLEGVWPLPFSRFHELPLAELGIDDERGFDAVNVLAHHVLAHVLSPRRLLARIHELLVPGGLLLLDEKDVLLPVRYKTRSVFDTGRAHQFHLTLATTLRYLEAAGFEVIDCAVDAGRISDFRHIRAVARKPRAGAAEAPMGDHGTALQVRQRLRDLDRSWSWQKRVRRRQHQLAKQLRRAGLARAADRVAPR